MLYAEKKTEKGYEYTAGNVEGKFCINSVDKLDGETLDAMVHLITRKNLNAETVKGSVEYEDGKTVSYILKREKQWQEPTKEDTDDVWKDTPTSTKKQASESTEKSDSPEEPHQRTSSWLQRFVGAFREAWKSSK